MKTDCNPKQLHFQGLGSRNVVADFDGGTITSDAGALLLREIEAANHFFDGFASCFADHLAVHEMIVDLDHASDTTERGEQMLSRLERGLGLEIGLEQDGDQLDVGESLPARSEESIAGCFHRPAQCVGSSLPGEGKGRGGPSRRAICS